MYRPQTKLRKGNVFTSMCQELCPCWGDVHTHPGQTPPWTDTSLADITPGQTPHPPGQNPPPHRHPPHQVDS